MLGGQQKHLALGKWGNLAYWSFVFQQGLNTRGIKGMAVKELAADISAAMAALGMSDADLLGFSQGGMIAQYLAIERPVLIHKLILAVTLSRNNETVAAAVNGWIEIPAGARSNADAVGILKYR